MRNVCSVSFGRPGHSTGKVGGGGMDHSSGVVGSLRNAPNYRILSLILMKAKVENERLRREQEKENQCLELLHCTSLELEVLPLWLKKKMDCHVSLAITVLIL